MHWFRRSSVCAALVSIGLTPIASASDITFEFEAVLDYVAAAASPSFSVGDVMSGSYTFDVVPNDPNGNYIGIMTAMSVTINGQTWTQAAGSSGNIFVRDGEIYDGPPELHFAAAANA